MKRKIYDKKWVLLVDILGSIIGSEDIYSETLVAQMKKLVVEIRKEGKYVEVKNEKTLGG